MAGKILTAEDFDKSGDQTKDTSQDNIPADQKFDEAGKAIVEEPEKKEAPVEDKAKGDLEPQPKPSDFKPKHKTWEETEKARLELERGFTEKSMKLSDSERELEKYRKPPEKPAPTIDDQITEIAESAIKEINAIPIEYDTEGKPKPESLTKRDRDAAVVWAKANRKISRLEIQETNRESESHKNVVSKLYKGATDGGLKSDDEMEMVGMLFDRTDPKLDLDTRVSQAVENTKIRISHFREGFVKGQELDKKEKDELKVLGRGSSRKGGKEEGKETKPSTMSQQLADMNESRRLKKDDLYH
jgi:hypothetical protein